MLWLCLALVFVGIQLLRARGGNCVAGTGFEFFCRFQAVSDALKSLLVLGAAYCLGIAVLGALWIWTQPENPPCPVCRGRSRTAYGICRWCGHNFMRAPSAAG